MERKTKWDIMKPATKNHALGRMTGAGRHLQEGREALGEQTVTTCSEPRCRKTIPRCRRMEKRQENVAAL